MEERDRERESRLWQREAAGAVALAGGGGAIWRRRPGWAMEERERERERRNRVPGCPGGKKNVPVLVAQDSQVLRLIKSNFSSFCGRF